MQRKGRQSKQSDCAIRDVFLQNTQSHWGQDQPLHRMKAPLASVISPAVQSPAEQVSQRAATGMRRG